MNIVISEGSLFSNSAEHSLFNTHHTGHTASAQSVTPVQKTEAVSSDVVRDAEKNFVKENSPAVNISISSAGKAALMSLDALNKGLKNFTNQSDNIFGAQVSFNKDSKASDITLSDEEKESFGIKENSMDTVVQKDNAEKVTGPSKNISNLSMYTDIQLKTMVSEGDITRGEMQQELDKRDQTDTAAKADIDPVMKQAIAAYNYQMSFQINAQMTN